MLVWKLKRATSHNHPALSWNCVCVCCVSVCVHTCVHACVHLVVCLCCAYCKHACVVSCGVCTTWYKIVLHSFLNFLYCGIFSVRSWSCGMLSSILSCLVTCVWMDSDVGSHLIYSGVLLIPGINSQRWWHVQNNTPPKEVLRTEHLERFGSLVVSTSTWHAIVLGSIPAPGMLY